MATPGVALVKWSQTFYTVNVKIYIEHLDIADINFCQEQILVNWKTYQQCALSNFIKINLFKNIAPMDCRATIFPGGLKLSLKKFPDDSTYWERLTMEEEDFPWIILDIEEQLGPWATEPSQ